MSGFNTRTTGNNRGKWLTLLTKIIEYDRSFKGREKALLYRVARSINLTGVSWVPGWDYVLIAGDCRGISEDKSRVRQSGTRPLDRVWEHVSGESKHQRSALYNRIPQLFSAIFSSVQSYSCLLVPHLRMYLACADPMDSADTIHSSLCS